jgi:hypothetical protein
MVKLTNEEIEKMFNGLDFDEIIHLIRSEINKRRNQK